MHSHINGSLLVSLGDSASDLDLSDDGSVTSSSSEEDSDTEHDILLGNGTLSLSSSGTSLPLSTSISNAHEKEFQAEVAASLARAFAEGHSVDNASVELKTLRMASNVPLRRVREAVVAGIVELIPIVGESAPQQRKEIARVVNRWGPLINNIGGVDAVETVTVLQVHIHLFS